MHRRALLATLGTAAGLTAGCLDRAGSDPTETDTAEPGATTDGEMTDPPADTTDEPTDSPAATPADPLSDVPCPTFAENVDRTVCWPHDDTAAESVSLDASSVVFEPPNADDGVATIEFVLHNRATESFGLNPHDWSVRRWTGDGWSLVAPEAHVEPWYIVESGGTYTWRLSRVEHSSPMSEDSMAVVQDLDDGIYAFQITGAFGEGPNSGTRVECVALFEVRSRA